MRTFTDSAYKQPPAPVNQAYSASVPLSVYRELAAELQATQTAIHQLTQQNEHLAQENHVLRQEIAKTVNAVMHLQNAVNYSANATYNNTLNTSVNQASSGTNEKRVASTNKQHKHQSVAPKRVKRPRSSPVSHQVTEYFEPLPEPVFIEEQQANYYYEDESEFSQVSGWWLIFAIVFIIVMGFGAGYVVVRPLLENHTR
ncbi:MAG: hypothetical protein SWZ49_15640 [Cyanobacteriota bacterium]|nr:hypothetical protein [Cyanobacteriota bacterium]